MAISDKRKQLYNQKYKAEYKERVHRMTLTFSNSEYAELEKRAKSENVKVTTLIKNMAIAYHQNNTIIPEPIADELKELRFLIHNIANNVNQFAHNSNMVQKLIDENGLLLEIQKMEKTVNNFAVQRLKQ